MRDYWFISDTHFGQSNILNFKKSDGTYLRSGFNDVYEMDEHMISKWNECVKPNDYIYHLGDVFFGDNKYFSKSIMPRLTGHIRLLLGNHDEGKYLSSFQNVKKIGSSRRFDEHGFVISHIPIHQFSRYVHRTDSYQINVHGHTHADDVVGHDANEYINICVEKTNYRPLNLDEIITMVKERQQ